MSKAKTTPGTISLSFWTSNKPPYKGVSIRIEDAVSGTEIVDVNMTLLTFAEMISGSSMRPVDVEFHGAPAFGKMRETKTEVVFIPDGEWKDREARAKKALKAFEVDGWSGNLSDALNHHRSKGQGKQEVGFTRFVDPTPEQLEKRLKELEERDG